MTINVGGTKHWLGERAPQQLLEMISNTIVLLDHFILLVSSSYHLPGWRLYLIPGVLTTSPNFAEMMGELYCPTNEFLALDVCLMVHAL